MGSAVSLGIPDRRETVPGLALRGSGDWHWVRGEDFTLEPVEGALGLGGAEALAPGDGRVIPLEAADRSGVELTVCQENIPVGMAPQHGSFSPPRAHSEPSTAHLACGGRGREWHLGKAKPKGSQGSPWAPWDPAWRGPASSGLGPTLPAYPPPHRASLNSSCHSAPNTHQPPGPWT